MSTCIAWSRAGRSRNKASGTRLKSTYLFPVRALSHRVRGGLVSRLRQAVTDGRLPRLKDAAQIEAMLDTLMGTDWVVYSKPCLTHTETVVDYFGRYSHRIALNVIFVYGDPKYYGRFGFRTDAANQYTAPYRLQYPFGWQANVINACDIDHSPVAIICVTSLCNPKLW